MIPVVETARLRLRGHCCSDLPQCVAMWSDPNVTKFIGGQASTEMQTWTKLLSYAGHWALMGFGYWAVEEKASGDFVGEVGFADFKRDIVASMRGWPELGFALAFRFHGKGYATEAVRAAISWADVNLANPRTVCLVDPQNRASLRVAAGCGYKVFDRGFYKERAALFLARDKP
jgi:RimJ/RimL family protein N-acetyltransferase